jgi:hypothetical protein
MSVLLTGQSIRHILLVDTVRRSKLGWKGKTMTITEALANVRYVLDARGERTDVLIPLTAWKAILASWKQMMESLEDQKDLAILEEWLAQRSAGETDTISLDDLERELVADGLLPS